MAGMAPDRFALSAGRLRDTGGAIKAWTRRRPARACEHVLHVRNCDANSFGVYLLHRSVRAKKQHAVRIPRCERSGDVCKIERLEARSLHGTRASPRAARIQAGVGERNCSKRCAGLTFFASGLELASVGCRWACSIKRDRPPPTLTAKRQVTAVKFEPTPLRTGA